MPQNEALLEWEIWTQSWRQSTQHLSSFWLNVKEYFNISETKTFEQCYNTQELFITCQNLRRTGDLFERSLELLTLQTKLSVLTQGSSSLIILTSSSLRHDSWSVWRGKNQNAFACTATSASHVLAQILSCKAPVPWEQQALPESGVHTFLSRLNVPKKDAEQA